MYPLIHAGKTNAFRLQCHFFQLKECFRVWLCEDVQCGSSLRSSKTVCHIVGGAVRSSYVKQVFQVASKTIPPPSNPKQAS